jgi:hypothetical protein
MPIDCAHSGDHIDLIYRFDCVSDVLVGMGFDERASPVAVHAQRGSVTWDDARESGDACASALPASARVRPASAASRAAIQVATTSFQDDPSRMTPDARNGWTTPARPRAIRMSRPVENDA